MAANTVTVNLVANTGGFARGMSTSVNSLKMWQREAKRVFESTRTPAEQFSFQLEKLNALHRKGHIDADTHARAVRNLRREYSGLSAFSGFKGIASKAFSLTGLGGLLTGVGLAYGAKRAIDAAQTQEQAEKKLAATLAATGNAAGFSARQLFEYAGALQNVTNYGDETIINAQAILATFKEIRGDTFKQATEAALDMSAVLGQDLKSSVIQLGKALNDPIQGVTALGRVGVSFTKSQLEQIKALQEAGDTMKAQQVILAELKSEFGGAARAMADPMIQAKNAMGDLAETIGMRLTPYIRAGAEAMREWSSEAAAAGRQAGLTSEELSQMGVFSRLGTWDWWAKGAADLGGSVKDTLGFMDAATVGAFKRAKAGDPYFFLGSIEDWFLNEFAETKTPSEQIDRQIRRARAQMANVNKAAAVRPASLSNGQDSQEIAETGTSLDKMIAKLRSDLATVGMDQAAKEAHKLNEQLEKLAKTTDDPFKVEELEKLIEKLREAREAADWKQKAEQWREREIKQDPAQVLQRQKREYDEALARGKITKEEHARWTAKAQDEFEKKDEWKQKADAWKQQDPLEAFKRQMAEFRYALKKGFIDQETYDRLAADAKQSTVQDMAQAPPQFQLPQAAVSQSQAAYSAVARAQAGATDPTIQLQRDANRKLTAIERGIDRLNEADLLKIAELPP